MEKKSIENVNEKVNVQENVVEEKVIETGLEIYLEREKFIGNNNKEYWAYVVKGIARGKAVKADFAPKDKGGYEALDLVFGDADKVELLISEESTTDANGKVNKYKVYTAKSVDEDGIEYTCNVKPARDSDKALFGMILAKMKANK